MMNRVLIGSLTVLTFSALTGAGVVAQDGFRLRTVHGFGGQAGTLRQNDPDRKEWLQLFNKRDLKDWTIKFAHHDLGANVNETFRVEDGLLKVRYDKWTTFNREFGHIFYKQPFSYYLLGAE